MKDEKRSMSEETADAELPNVDDNLSGNVLSPPLPATTIPLAGTAAGSNAPAAPMSALMSMSSDYPTVTSGHDPDSLPQPTPAPPSLPSNPDDCEESIIPTPTPAPPVAPPNDE